MYFHLHSSLNRVSRHGNHYVKRLVVSAWCVSSLSRRPLAHIAEGRGRFTGPTTFNGGKTKSKSRDALINSNLSLKETMEQFADRLLQLQSPGVRAHSRTPVVTSPSAEQATLRTLALQLFQNYPTRPWYHPEKQGRDKQRLFQFLADECAPSQTKVLEAAQVFVKRCEMDRNNIMNEGVNDNSDSKSQPQSSSNTEVALPSIHHLQQACIPEYQSVLTHLIQQQADQGIDFLLQFRQDLLNYMAYLQAQPHHDSTMLHKYKQLDHYILSLLQTWFAPGLLQVQPLSYETTSAAIVERMARKEAVHPMQSLEDLRHRLGGNQRRVFGLFHSLLTNRPLLVLYVSLEPEIPASMETIHNNHGDDEDSKEYDIGSIRVATFYSISNLESGLKGVGLGEFLIHQAVECLQAELPHLQTFCTLSPLPTFRKWLEERTQGSSKLSTEDLLDRSTTQQLAQYFQVTPNQAVTALVEYLQTVDRSSVVSQSDDDDAETDAQSVDEAVDWNSTTKSPAANAAAAAANAAAPPLPHSLLSSALLKLAAHYLLHEKHRRLPLDPVARFHIGNGALVHAIRYKADWSRKGWNQSFGIMVNYEYVLSDLQRNRAVFEESFVIPMSESVKELVE